MSNRARAIAVLVAVFFVGCLVGILVFHEWEERSGESHGNPRASAPEVGARFARTLQLSTDQQKQLKMILEESRQQIDATRAEMGKKFDEVRAATNARIAAILTDEQKKKFEEMLKDADSHRPDAERHGRRSGH